ncbi:MAG TPA: hypothetical protein DEV96_02000, partial [Rhodospirillum rubrum]|nr:hypothetical protein [Rhodospirillum rubrum]
EKPKRKRAAPRKKAEAAETVTNEAAASPEAEAPAEKPKRKRAAPRKKAEAAQADAEAEVAAPTEPRED